MQIITNNQPRPLLDWYELTPAQQADFDYEGADEGSYFMYRGQVHALADFPAFDSAWVAPLEADSPFKGWDAASHCTWSSGTLIKYTPCCEAVIVGRYY
jgi:hypothetical protein